MKWPSRDWWKRHGFYVEGSDDDFTVHVGVEGWGLILMGLLLLIGGAELVSEVWSALVAMVSGRP